MVPGRLPESWIPEYRERVSAVSLKEAAATAQRHLFADDRTIVFVGSAEQLKSKVEKYGPVTVLKPAELK